MKFDIKTYPTITGKKHVHMKELFDMIAGRQTGSILAAGLSMPARDADHPNIQPDVPKYSS